MILQMRIPFFGWDRKDDDVGNDDLLLTGE